MILARHPSQSWQRLLRRSLALAVALQFVSLLSLSRLCVAQNVDTGAGFPPFTTVAGGQFDSLALPYGSVHLEFPIRAKAGKYPLKYSLAGNSHPYIGLFPTYSNPYNEWISSAGTLGTYGVVSGSPLADGLSTGSGFTTTQTEPCQINTSYGLESGWVVIDQEGTTPPYLSK